MNLTIIGSGNMARGIGTRLVSGGHSVTIMDRKPEKAKALAEELAGTAGKNAKAKGAALGTPIQDEIVFLAIPYGATSQVIENLGKQLGGKIVIDITNPLNGTYSGMAVEAGTSAAEEIAKKLPSDAVVLKAFNTTFAGTLVNGKVDGTALDVFIAGDAEEPKQKVSKLVEDSGLRPIDAGALERARQLEAIGFLGITLQQELGTGFQSAWKIIS
ncbi:MAG TPA: NADPH-dependent F420 reductase [Anaerolineales bacterium]